MLVNDVIFYFLAITSIIVWGFMVFFRGQFWRSNQFLPNNRMPLKDPPEIVIIIPSRNEEFTIGQSISSLLQQNYSGIYSIIVVNDNSSDETINAVRRASKGQKNITLIDGTELPDKWNGKIWAIAQGIELARKNFSHAKYYLFTDADIFHHPENLSELTCKATNENLALVSLMSKLRCVSIWEILLIPAFIFFFQKLYPFSLVNDPNKSIAGAAGGCMLVNSQHLEEIGGIETIKDAVIDDCTLAKHLKEFNPIWLGLTRSIRSLREYHSFRDISRMVSRTAFTQLNYSILNLFVTVVGMLIIYIIPVISVFIGVWADEKFLIILGLIAWLMMVVTYTPTLGLYNRPIIEAGFLPVAALLYSAMTINSAWQHMAGNAPIWKGRKIKKQKRYDDPH